MKVIQYWKDGTYRYNRRIILKLAFVGKKTLWVYKTTGRLVVFN